MNSNNAISIFKNENFGEIRVVMQDGEPWFVVRDLTELLGYESNNRTSIIAAIPLEWKGRRRIATPGGPQEMWCVSEQGLYFFLGRSDKPKALPFQKWVAGEVLPSIRKRGAYVYAKEDDTPEIVMARGLLAAKDAIDRLQARIEADAPKVEIHDNYLSLDHDEEKLVNWFAKYVTGQGYRFSDKQMFAWLRDQGYLMRKTGSYKNVPYQRYIDLGWFKVKEVWIHSISDFRRTPVITNLGVVELFKKIKKWSDKNLKASA